MLATKNAMRHTVPGDVVTSVCQGGPGTTSREEQVVGLHRAVEMMASRTALVSASPGDMEMVSLRQLACKTGGRTWTGAGLQIHAGVRSIGRSIARTKPSADFMEGS